MSETPTTHEVLERCARRIEMGVRMTVEGVLTVGQSLCEARDTFNGHDKAFGQWRETRLPWIHRQHALRCMQVWENLGPRLVQHNVAPEWSNTVLFALAAPATPDSVRETLFDRAQQGERVTVADVEALKREAKVERQAREQLAAELSQLQRQNQTLQQTLTAAADREARQEGALRETRNQIQDLAEAQSREAIEQARRDLQAATGRVEELRQQLQHAETERQAAIQVGVKHGLAQRQEELNQLERDIHYAENTLAGFRQKLREISGAEYENQRLNIDAEKVLREIVLFGTTLNLYECEEIFPVNWGLLDQIVIGAESLAALVGDFKANHRLTEKPVAPS